MKLTVKLIFTTVLIVALAVSICSYLLLSGSFRSELNMQYEAAMQEALKGCTKTPFEMMELSCEALELTRQFGEDNATSFVNGILDAAAKALEKGSLSAGEDSTN